MWNSLATQKPQTKANFVSYCQIMHLQPTATQASKQQEDKNIHLSQRDSSFLRTNPMKTLLCFKGFPELQSCWAVGMNCTTDNASENWFGKSALVNTFYTFALFTDASLNDYLWDVVLSYQYQDSSGNGCYRVIWSPSSISIIRNYLILVSVQKSTGEI